MQSELSLIQAAETVLRKHKKPVDIYQLFDESLDLSFFHDEDKDELVTKFYADLITSALFIYVGDNMWDLKENQKIELWDKDGSHYKEYTVVELPKEEKPKPKPKPATTPEKVVEAETTEEVVEEVQEEVIEPKEKVVPQVEVVAENNEDDAVDDYEEEVFDEYDDDFDEDKYNEYMDTYEDQYDD